MSYVSFDQARSMNNLARYATGAAINRQEESSGVVTGTLFMGGVSGATWAWKNRKNLSGAWKNLAKEAAQRDQIVKSTKVVANGKPFSKIRNLWAGASKYVAQQEAAATAAKAANTAAKASKATGFFGKVKNFLGFGKAGKFIKGVTTKYPKSASLLKGIKGNAGFALISFGLGVVSDVIPSFQIGATEGFKQLGKTALKTAAEVGGWAAGTALGAKAGAVIGTCIGGPIGTAIGGLVGAACGFLGSWLASKAADKVVGPSEVEIAQQKNAEQLSKEAATDSNLKKEVVGQALQNLVAHYAQNGQLSDDDKIAKNDLEKVLGEKINLDELAKEYTAQAQSEQQTAPQDTTAPSAQQQAIQMEAQQQAEAQSQTQLASLQQQTTVPQPSSTQEQDAEDVEEPQGKQDKKKTQQQYTMPSYQSTLTNPLLASTNSFSMSNPYGSIPATTSSFDSYNIFNQYGSVSANPYGMYNQNDSIFSNANQASQQQDQTKFKYNPNV